MSALRATVALRAALRSADLDGETVRFARVWGGDAVPGIPNDPAHRPVWCAWINGGNPLVIGKALEDAIDNVVKVLAPVLPRLNGRVPDAGTVPRECPEEAARAKAQRELVARQQARQAAEAKKRHTARERAQRAAEAKGRAILEAEAHAAEARIKPAPRRRKQIADGGNES